MKSSLLILSGGLLLAAPASAQVANTAVLTNTTTLRSNGLNFTNAATGTYAVQSTSGVFEHNTANYTFTNDGSYDASGTGGQYGTDHFTGTGTATIAGSVQPTFGNLTFANRTADTLAITNAAGARVAGTLNWSGGGLITTPRTGTQAATALEFGPTASHTNSSAHAQHVDGYVKKQFDPSALSFDYPVGNGSTKAPLQVTVKSADASAAISVAYLGGAPTTADPTAAAANMTPPVGLMSISGIGAWDIIAPANNDTVTLQATIPDMSGAGGYATGGEMRLVGYNTATSQWVALGTVGTSGNSGGQTLVAHIPPGMLNNITSMAVGSATSWPLALDLLSFSAEIDASCTAQLRWQTANEQGVKGFEVEYGTDGRTYRRVGEVAATGDGGYTFQFDGVQNGAGFFRLKTVDFDGSAEYSRSVQVRASCGGAGSVVVGPNPLRDEMMVTGLTGESTLRVFTMSGALVYERVVNASSARISTAEWASGSYILRVSAEGREPVVQRLTKQ